MGTRGKKRLIWPGLFLLTGGLLTGISAAEDPGGGVTPVGDGPEALFRQGIASYREGCYAEAIAHLEASLATSPTWAEYAHFYLLDSHGRSGHGAETLGLCKAFRQRYPNSVLEGRVARIEAEAYRRLSDPRLASRAYEAVLRKEEDAKVRLQYGEVLEELGRRSDAYANYQRIRRKWPTSPEGRTAKARARKILYEHPESVGSASRVSYLRDEASLCFKERAYGEAVSLYEELQGLAPSQEERDRAFLHQVLAHAALGRPETAHGVLRTWMQDHPASKAIPEALLEVGRGYWRSNRNREALPVLTQLLEGYTDTGEAARGAFILGRVHFEEGDLENAIRQFRETRFLYPDTEWEEEAAWGEAWCYYLLGRYDVCAEHLNSCILENVWDLSVPRALYWQARCLERAGRPWESRPIYERTRDGYPESYYSLLAQWRLSGKPLAEVIASGAEGPGREEDGSMRPGPFEKLGDPTVPLLLDAGLRKDAAERLDWLRRGVKSKAMAPEDWVEAYCLAGDVLKGWTLAGRKGLFHARLRAWLSGRDPKARRFLRLLYPLPSEYDIRENAGQRGLDPLLVAGLIHQESVFMADAVSPAGAIGLMQIMPATGRHVAAKVGLENFRAESLYEPEVNLAIGTAYLQGLAGRYDRDWPRVFAAYNAGPAAVERWTALMPLADTDEFVEGIRYKETRLYVKKVLFNWALYHRMYGAVRGPEAAREGRPAEPGPAG
jgi:soluble lytic murein transglycosylase